LVGILWSIGSKLPVMENHMQDSGWEMHIKSLGGAIPILLGDPRKLSSTDFSKYKAYADWHLRMQTKHDFMSFRQSWKGFGEPKEGRWDGFQRINSETRSGGIVGIFNQGSVETQRQETVQLLDPLVNYSILTVPEGIKIGRMNGKKLEQKGFQVKLDQKYDGTLFEIVRNK
jgi:alpha-galactosidase